MIASFLQYSSKVNAYVHTTYNNVVYGKKDPKDFQLKKGFFDHIYPLYLIDLFEMDVKVNMLVPYYL